MDRTFLGAMEAIARTIETNKDYLTDLDRVIGDADHGINMARGFHAVMEKLHAAPPDTISDGLKVTAMTLISTVGGASGPLYGTAFLRCSKTVQGKNEIDRDAAEQLLADALEGIVSRGKAQPGDKTIVDALGPAHDAFQAAALADKSLAECLDEACAAAQAGVEYTKTIAARKGRASYLGERSIGHQDPGATSVTMILQTLTDYCKGQ